ncbi:MAG: hypothetical protein AB9888_09165 [Bacteroidales bacterium]
MKQKIYLLGLLTAIVVVLGCIFKINHWPGAGYLLILGTFSLVFLFLPLALRNHYLGAGNRKNILLHIITWVTCLVVFLAMLFKVMHWPGAGVALIIALPFPYLVFLPAYVINAARNRDSNIHNTVYVLLLLAGFSVFSLLLALNVSKERIDISMDLSRNYNRVEEMIDRAVPSIDQAGKGSEIDELLSVVNEYQELIFTSEEITEQQWENDPWVLTKPEYTDIAAQALMNHGTDPEPPLKLEQAIRKFLSAPPAVGARDVLIREAPAILHMEDTSTEPYEWTKGTFGESPRVWSVIYLDALETNLKLIRAGF